MQAGRQTDRTDKHLQKAEYMCGAKRFWSKFEHLNKLATGTPVKTKRSIGEKKILRLCWE